MLGLADKAGAPLTVVFLCHSDCATTRRTTSNDSETTMGVGPTDERVVEAAAQAEHIAAELRNDGGDLKPVYAALDEAISTFEAQDIMPQDLLPADAEPGLGMALSRKRDGKTLWEAIVVAGRDRICAQDSEVRRAIATQTGATALVTAVVATLGLSIVALPIAAPIVGFLLAAGVDGFCTWATAPPDDGP